MTKCIKFVCSLKLWFKITFRCASWNVVNLNWIITVNVQLNAILKMLILYFRCVVAVSYFTLVLFSSRMAGNPFLNFLLQSVVEIPAYLVGKYLGKLWFPFYYVLFSFIFFFLLFIADKYGRRFTNSSSFFVSFLICIPIIILATGII